LSRSATGWVARVDEDARVDFTAFVVARSPRLLRSAQLLSGGDPYRAEDLLQTALARTYLAWGRISSEDPERYVRRVLVNLSTDWWRAPWSRVQTTDTNRVDRRDVPSVDDVVADRDILRRALQKLSPRERAVLVCRFYWDLSEIQTAAELGWPLGSVKSTTSRALGKIRTLLTPPIVPSQD